MVANDGTDNSSTATSTISMVAATINGCEAVASAGYGSFTFGAPAIVGTGQGKTATYTGIGSFGGTALDLKITSTTQSNNAIDHTLGNSGDDVSLTLTSGSDATMTFEFFETGTSNPVNVSLAFLIKDLDGTGGATVETVKINSSNIIGFSTNGTSNLRLSGTAGVLAFSGTDTQADTDASGTIQINIENQSSFQLTFEAGGQAGNTDFLFDADGDIALTSAVCSPPVLDLDDNNSSTATDNDFSNAYTQGGTPAAIADTDTEIIDVNDLEITGATITLTNILDGTDEGLSVTSSLPAGITASSYNTGTGVLTLTGNSPLSDYEAALSRIGYFNDKTALNTTDRSVTVTITDGTLTSQTATTTISVAASDPCVNITTYSFESETLESGTALQQGAVYRFPTVATGVDALVTLTTVSNVTVEDMDLPYSPAPGNMQPKLKMVNHNVNDGKGFVDFTVQFVTTGTSTPISQTEINLFMSDMDGNGTARDFIGFNDGTIIVESTGNITSEQVDGFNEYFPATTSSVGGVANLNGPNNSTYAKFANATTITLRIGFRNGTNNLTRQFPVTFQPCPFNNISVTATSPVTTDNTLSVDEDGTLTFANADFAFSDDDSDGFAAVTISSLPANGTLFYNGVAITANDVTNATEYTTVPSSLTSR